MLTNPVQIKMTFKVGDRVKLIKIDKLATSDKLAKILMKLHENPIATIIEVHNRSYTIAEDEHNWYWYEDDLEKIVGCPCAVCQSYLKANL